MMALTDIMRCIAVGLVSGADVQQTVWVDPSRFNEDPRKFQLEVWEVDDKICYHVLTNQVIALSFRD